MRGLRIDRLELRLQGTTRSEAASIVRELRGRLPAELRRLALAENAPAGDAGRIEALDVRAPRGANGAETAAGISRATAGAVRGATAKPGGGRF